MNPQPHTARAEHIIYIVAGIVGAFLLIALLMTLLWPAPTTVQRPGMSFATRCATSGTYCPRALLRLINVERAAHGERPLRMDYTQSRGMRDAQGILICGAQMHANHMAQMGQISHDQFPVDICSTSYGAAAENVGEAQGSEWQAIQQIHIMMQAEPWTPGCVSGHHCTWLSTRYTRVGIAFAHNGDTWYDSEEYLG